MFNMLGRTAIIALHFEYFIGSVIHIHRPSKGRVRVHGLAPSCITTNVSVNPSFWLWETTSLVWSLHANCFSAGCIITCYARFYNYPPEIDLFFNCSTDIYEILIISCIFLFYKIPVQYELFSQPIIFSIIFIILCVVIFRLLSSHRLQNIGLTLFNYIKYNIYWVSLKIDLIIINYALSKN